MSFRFLAALLCLGLSACATGPGGRRLPPGVVTDFWFTPLRDCSTATRAHPRFEVMFLILTPDGHRVPGILVKSRRLGRIEPARAYPDIVLRANGVPVHTGARGEVFEGMGQYYAFYFEIEPLLRRHPDGFTLELARGSRTLLRAELDGAQWAFGELLDCAAGEPPDFPPRPRLQP